MTKELTIKNKKFNAIITRAGDIDSLNFKTIDDKSLVEINSWMPVVNRGVSCFSKQNSQTTSSLMSLNMLDSGPYRVLRQILAQVEKKRSALKENIYKLEKNKLMYEECIDKIDSQVGIEARKLELRANKLQCDIIDSQPHIEAAIKELGALKRRYEEVCKNKNIPEDWNEVDFEEAEIKHHIITMFKNAIRDRMQGSHNMGTLEYFCQYGINGVVAYSLVDDYLKSIKQSIENGKKEGKLPTIDSEYTFLDEMYNIFKDEYKRAMERIGLDNITHSDFLMKG